MSKKTKPVPKVDSKFAKSLQVDKKDSETMVAVKQALSEIFAPMLVAGSLPISGLPADTTPLDGTELLAIVQGAQTRKAEVSDLVTYLSTLEWDADEFQGTPIASGTSNGTAYVYLTNNAEYSLMTVPYVKGRSLVPHTVDATAAYQDLQSFTLNANTITVDDQKIRFEAMGIYTNAVSLNLMLGSHSGGEVDIAAPSGPSNYRVVWEFIRLNSAQATSSLFVTGGTGVDAFTTEMIVTMSALDWAIDNTIKIQGKCNVAINTLEGLNARFYVE